MLLSERSFVHFAQALRSSHSSLSYEKVIRLRFTHRLKSTLPNKVSVSGPEAIPLRARKYLFKRPALAFDEAGRNNSPSHLTAVVQTLKVKCES